MVLTIGVDVGGTKVAAGVVDEQGRIVAKLKRSTPAASPEQTADVISDAVLELLRDHQAAAVGLGAAGFVDEARATVLFAPNLAWRDEPVKKKVEDRVGLPVIVENDANATAWAETIFGAARGHEHVVLLTVGTGIGAGIVVNGELYRGRWGAGGEPGHYRVVPDGRLCGCGNRGCLEQYASETRWSRRHVSSPRARQAGPSACFSLAAARRRESAGLPSRRRPARETRPRCAASRSSAAGWARAWPTWPRSWTPAAS